MKYKKNRGFTLIECTAYLSIAVIVLSISIKLLGDLNKIYINSLRQNINLNKIEEGIHLINLIKGVGVDKVIGNDESITFRKNIVNGDCEIKKICKKDKNLIVEHSYLGDELEFLTSNVILRNVDDFKVISKGNMYYLAIVVGGKKYIKSI